MCLMDCRVILCSVILACLACAGDRKGPLVAMLPAAEMSTTMLPAWKGNNYS